MLQVESIERICNVTHAYNKKINYGQELIIELTYNILTPGYHDTFACGVYYNCIVSAISWRFFTDNIWSQNDIPTKNLNEEFLSKHFNPNIKF